MKLIVVLIAAIGGSQACQRERTFKPHAHSHVVKRQSANATFPPVLDANEQLLVDSFDNTSIASWSYYYSKRKASNTKLR
jgi:N-acetylated-alpha-linked acidic dipeptidase